MNRKPPVVFVFTLLLCASGMAVAQRQQTPPLQGLRDVPPSKVALVDATVVIRPGESIKNAAILIDGGTVIDVGEGLTVPAEYRPLDMVGRTIYAGFVDSYSELEMKSVPGDSAYWNPRVTPQRSVANEVLDSPAAHKSYRAAGFVARLLAPKSGLIKGTSALIANVDDAKRGLVLRSNVAMHAALTVEWSFERREEYPSSPMGALTLVRQALYDADWYRQAWRVHHATPAVEPPEVNTALQALVDAEAADLAWIVDASNERFLLRADRLGREFGLRVLARGSGREFRRLDDIVRTGRGVIVPLNFPKAPDVTSQESAMWASLDRLLEWDLAPENPGRLAKAGVPMGLTSHGLKSRREFWPALRRAIRRGLDPQVALAALTTTPAAWFGVSDRLGTIERGKSASFTIADGDLFDLELEEPPKVVETWIQGQRYPVEQSDPRSLRGAWSLQWDDPDQGVTNLKLHVSGQPGDWKGKIRGEGKAAEVRDVVWSESRLTLVVPLGAEPSQGWLRFTFVLPAKDLSVEQPGTGSLPDGRVVAARLRRTGDLAEEPDSADETSEKAVTGHDRGDEVRTALFDVVYPLGAYGRESRPPQPDLVIFQHATVWTCGPAGVIPDGTVRVERGRITQVGASDRGVTVPPHAVVIDCQGRHLTPGIIDCHSHIATDSGLNEGTQAVTAEVRIADFIDSDDISIYRQLAGGVTTANVLHGSANPIGGQNQVIKLRWGGSPEQLKFREAPPGIKFALGENVKQSNWGDDHTTRYPQTRMGVVEIIDDAFLRARDYARRQDHWRRDRIGLPPRVDLELEALAEVLAGRRWIHCHSYRQSEIMALIQTCDRHGVPIGTFQHILEGYKLADEMAQRRIMGSAFSDWWAYKFEVYDAIPYAGALMHEAGVVVSFNSDDAELARRLNMEAAKAIRYGGVPAEDALKFVTLNPARQLRIDRYVGSLEVGKHADVAVWNGDPLSAMTRCEQAWIDGRKYFDEADARTLEIRDRQRHAALVQRVLDTKSPQIKPEEERPNPHSLWPREDTFCHGHP